MPGRILRRKEHPFVVKTLSELPEGLRLLAEQALPAREAVDTIFVVPTQTLPKTPGGLGGMHRIPEQALVFTASGVLHVLGEGPAGQSTYLRGDELLYAHHSLVLLYGRLELCGAGPGGLTSIVLEYNAVGQHLLQPPFQRFLRLAWDPARTLAEEHHLPTERLLDEAIQASYKFGNGLRCFGLQPGERLLGSVFQPTIEAPFARIFRRKISPATLIALTDQQLIVIEEGLTKNVSYGWRLTFFPRSALDCVELIPQEESQAVHVQPVRVQLSRGRHSVERRARLGEAAAPAWQALWERLTR